MLTDSGRLKRAQYLFGTVCSIELEGASPAALHDAAEAAFAEMSRIQQLINPYDADSELCRLAMRAGQGPVAARDELLALIDVALWMSRHTGGRYDPTVWPLLQLWRGCERAQRWPTDAELGYALGAVGHGRVRLDRRRGTVRLIGAQTRLDLSSLAKGYALDCALGAAGRFPIERALLNAGGELLAWSRSDDATLVGLADPRDRGEIIGLIELRNQAVSSSAQSEPHLVIRGRTVGHLLDTRTGRPVRSPLCGVSVVAGSALLADLLSTACFVIDAAEAQALLRGVPGASGLLLRQDGRGLAWNLAGRFPLVERLELTGMRSVDETC